MLQVKRWQLSGLCQIPVGLPKWSTHPRQELLRLSQCRFQSVWMGRMSTWQLTLGEYSTTGTGPNKKLARNVAAEQMMAQLPEEWKSKKSGAGTKRPGFGSRGGPSPKKKQQSEPEDGKVVITADNPVSCLYEYAKNVKIADPEFSCIAENLLETWQKANQTFKKIEYTMQLKIDGKTYLASSNQKKAAKQATAAEAWNAIRATLL